MGETRVAGDGFRPAGCVPGMIFCPREGRARKHPCPDCHGCNVCSDARCEACLAGKAIRPAGRPAEDARG